MMEKRILLPMALAMLCHLSVGAQTHVSQSPANKVANQVTNPLIQTSRTMPMLQKQKASQRLKSPKTAPGEVWWGYWDGESQLIDMGIRRADTYHAAQVFDNALVKGKTLKALRVAVQGTAAMENLKVWVSTSFPDDGNTADVAVVDIDKSTVTDGEPFTVELPEPYTVPADGFYAGVVFTISEVVDNPTGYPLLCTYNGQSIADHFFVKTDTYIQDWQDVGLQGFGDLGMQLLLQGDFAENALTLSDFQEFVAEKGKPTQFTLPVQNQGIAGLSSIDYTLTLDGQTSDERHLDLDTPFLKYYGNTELQVAAEGASRSGFDKLVINVTKINGEAVEGELSASGSMITVDTPAKRTPFVEFFTSTQQGFSPAELTATELLRNDYPDVAIVKYHVNDPMEVTWFYGTLMSFPYAPGARINRLWDGTCYWGNHTDYSGYGLSDIIAEQQQQPTEGTITIDGTPTFNSDGTVNVSANAQFGYNRDNNPYQVEFIVVADSLSGDDPMWEQLNTFPEYKDAGFFDDDPNLQQWLSAAGSIAMKYSDVAVRSDGYMPMGGSIVSGQDVAYSATVDLTGDGMMGSLVDPMIQEFGHLKVIAVLYNSETQKVVNVAEAAIAPASDIPEYGVAVADAPTVFTLEGGEQEFTVQLRREGQHVVKDIDYTLTIDGVTSDEQHLETSELYALNTTQGIDIAVNAKATPGSVPYTLNVTKVNGQPNGSTESEGGAQVITLAENNQRKPVIEEFTGGWCGWCPRGAVGLSLAKEQFADDVVVYAVHSMDAMQVEDFSPLLWDVYYFPVAYADRQDIVDPYHGWHDDHFGYHLDEVITSEQQAITEGAVALQQATLAADQGVVNVTASTTFSFDAPTADYSLAFVLIADGLKGEGSAWRQNNDYAVQQDSPNYGSDENLTDLLNAPRVINDYVYNEVAIQGSNPYGIDGSITAPIVSGAPQVYEYSFDIAGNSLLQNPDNLKVAVLLIDTKTGRIVNADEVAVSKTETGISSIAAQNGIKAIYTLGGMRTDNLRRGINIVRNADGSLRKIVKQ